MVKIGYIYKLAIKDGSLDECYIGSTSCIKVRKWAHKQDCNNPKQRAYHYYVYEFIRQNEGFQNWDLYPLEEVKYDNKIELLKKEREWVEKLKSSLNKQIPSRTKKEHYEVNKTKYQEQARGKYEENKEKYKEKNKKWKMNNPEKLKKYREKINCECGGKYILSNKISHFNSKKHQKYLSVINV